MRNHLFIGLGGQGGRTIAELRKVFDTRRDAVAELERDHHFHHDYLYIDSSQDVSNDRSIWSHFGRSVALPDNRRYALGAAQNLDLEQLALDPGIMPWLGSPALAANHLGLDQLRYPGANQKRRLGRIMFYQNAGPIRDRICIEILPPMLQHANRCTFHIFASLAGGTGSGSLIDLITLLRTRFPDPTLETGSPIFAYVYVTASDFADANVGYFHENQYAALRDLNALMSGRYQPHLFAHHPGGVPFDGDFPVNQVVLVSDVNANHQLVNLDRQIRATAEAAFERMYLYVTGQLNVEAQRTLTGEDILGAYPGEPREGGRVQRSYRFGALGMRRWEVPVEETTELLARKLGTNALTKLLYQNWANETGYVDQLPPHNPLLNDLVVGILDASIRPALTSNRLLPQMREALQRAAISISRNVLRQAKDEVLGSFESEMDGFYHNGLLEQGADALFQHEELQMEARLDQLMQGISTSLIKVWSRRQNALGFAGIPGLMEALRQAIEGQINDLQNQVQQTEEMQRAEQRNVLRFEEWNKITVFSRPIMAGRMLAAFGDDLRQLRMGDARRRACQLDVAFLNDLLNRLQSLDIHYQDALRRLQQIRRWSQDRADTIQQSLTNLAEEQGANRYEISAEDMRRFLQYFQLDSEGIRAAFTQMANELSHTSLNFGVPHLATFQVGPGCELLQAVEEDLYTLSQARHQVLIGQHVLNPVLTGNLLDILQQRWQANQGAFCQEFRDFINGASTLLEVDSGQPQPAVLFGVGNVASMPRRIFALGVPAGHPFAPILQDRFNQHAFGPNTIRYVYHHGDATQIRLLSMTSWMGMRFAVLTHQLKVKFDNCMVGPNAANVRYCCNLDPDGEREVGRPRVLLPEPEEYRSLFEAGLWLGRRVYVPGYDTKVILENNDGMRFLMSVNEAGNLAQQDITNGGADYQLCPRVLTSVEGAVAACTEEQKRNLRLEVENHEAQLQPGTPEFGQWIRVRDEILTFLDH